MKQTKILVVDDEARGVDLLVRTLHGIGEVVTAASADEGWERLQDTAFDLVVSDQRMPGMSGIELLSLVAKNFPRTGRILLTGYTDLEATLDAINQGQVHAYLTKPCAPPEVQKAVGEVLQRMRGSAAVGGSAEAEFDKQLVAILDLAERIRTHVEAVGPIAELAEQLVEQSECLLNRR